MATLLENWRTKAYGDELGKEEQKKLWQEYFSLEKGFYEEILKDPSHVYEGSLKELAEHFKIDSFFFTGVLDGIDESLKGYHNPIESMDEDTVVKIEIDPEKLYYNMVEARSGTAGSGRASSPTWARMARSMWWTRRYSRCSMTRAGSRPTSASAGW